MKSRCRKREGTKASVCCSHHVLLPMYHSPTTARSLCHSSHAKSEPCRQNVSSQPRIHYSRICRDFWVLTRFYHRDQVASTASASICCFRCEGVGLTRRFTMIADGDDSTALCLQNPLKTTRRKENGIAVWRCATARLNHGCADQIKMTIGVRGRRHPPPL